MHDSGTGHLLYRWLNYTSYSSNPLAKIHACYEIQVANWPAKVNIS